MAGTQFSDTSIQLKDDGPTELSFDDLFTWVIWQFPRKRGAWQFGAVKPPIPNHGWLPALIKQGERIVQVFGHIKLQCDTPDDALNWMISSKSG